MREEEQNKDKSLLLCMYSTVWKFFIFIFIYFFFYYF